MVSDEEIHLKGIILIVNFQEERFDILNQRVIMKYHQIFPLTNFWEHIIIIFSHEYGDPNGDSLDEIRQSKEVSNKVIFTELMEKFQNISDIVDYKELKIKDYNSYSPVKNEKQKIQNNKNKEDLEILLNDLCQKKPLFKKYMVYYEKNIFLFFYLIIFKRNK